MTGPVARLLAIDAGTTGVTALVVDDQGAVLARGYEEFPQHFPQPGWVEHDAEDIWSAALAATRDACERAGIAARELAAIAITNQRETAVLWDRATGRPLHHAIVWQDRRTAGVCDRHRSEGVEGEVRARTGLPLDAYFSATKFAWLLDRTDPDRTASARGRIAAGTVDSWLIWKLTGGRSHVTDPSNASRTLLYNLAERDWDLELCELFGVPASVLPETRPSAGHVGITDPSAFLGASVPITGIAGDQQAALFGQGCWSPGMSKNTYGTGSFLLSHAGTVVPTSTTTLTSVGWDLGDGPVYVLEGSIFVTGAAIQWLRDGLCIIDDASEVGALAGSVNDTDDLFLVPAFTGLGAPWWDPYARGTLIGITRGTTRAHVARAAVEAMAFQTRDVIDAMEADTGLRVAELRVDGGASVMDVLCQFQADLLGRPVLRPEQTETTAMGAAYLGGLGAGVWSSTAELAEVWRLDRRYTPGPGGDGAVRRLDRWHEAVARSRGWAPPHEDAGAASKAHAR